MVLNKSDPEGPEVSLAVRPVGIRVIDLDSSERAAGRGDRTVEPDIAALARLISLQGDRA
jgi:hypothetical protein